MSMSIVYLLLLLALANSHPPPDDVLMEEAEEEPTGNNEVMDMSNTVPKIILNEVYQFQDRKFVEIQSEVSSVSLDHFYILIMDYSRTGVLPPALKMRAAIKLSGLEMTDHYGYIGKSLT